MRGSPPKRRFPRPRVPQVQSADRARRSLRDTWLGRLTWFALGGVVALAVPFLSQGPDAIRRIPEIPAAISETINTVWERYQIDRGLTGSWQYVPSAAGRSETVAPILLVLRIADGRISGEMHSRSVTKWTIYDMALIEGVREGSVLKLTVFDFILGKRTVLASVTVRFQEEPSDGITDHFPALVDSELTATTTWQKSLVLPSTFTLRRVAD
jgi:hypothetical protein